MPVCAPVAIVKVEMLPPFSFILVTEPPTVTVPLAILKTAFLNLFGFLNGLKRFRFPEILKVAIVEIID